MTLTRERSQVQERPETGERIPRTQAPTSFVYWVVALLVLAAVALVVWFLPGEARLGEPATWQDFALMEDSVDATPDVIRGDTIQQFALMEDSIDASPDVVRGDTLEDFADMENAWTAGLLAETP